jgi:hypothetical protein
MALLEVVPLHTAQDNSTAGNALLTDKQLLFSRAGLIWHVAWLYQRVTAVKM